MCAILDASVIGEVFGRAPPEAAVKFLQWINKGSGRLVAGGKLLRELNENALFQEWARQALLSGRMKVADEQRVAVRATKLKKEGLYESDDPHVLALAQISGARLLYSNDRDLTNDFRDTSLIDNPHGKVYTTRKDKDAPRSQDNTKFRRSHRELLKRNVCQT